MRKEWTIETIKMGFEKFRGEFNRLPKALEIDKLSYLPSSRFIQKRFGGLESLRKQMGYADTNFGKGLYRTQIANRVNLRGRDAELELQRKLGKIFGEVFVHTEKIFDHSKNRVDFYIYSPDGNIGIDIFFTDSLHSLQSNVNIKMHKYKNFAEKLYLVSANDTLLQSQLDYFVKSKLKALPENIKLVTTQTLLKLMQIKNAYPNPINQS